MCLSDVVVRNAIECASLCLDNANCGSIQTFTPNEDKEKIQCTLILSGLTDALVGSSRVVDKIDPNGVWNLYANQDVKGQNMKIYK